MPSKSDIRRAILHALRPERDRPPSQFLGLRKEVAGILGEWGHEEGLRGEPPSQMIGQTEQYFREVLWELISTGILVPGKDKNNNKWPWLSLTTEGHAYLQSEEPPPSDPDGFLEYVKEAYPGISSLVLTYLKEGIEAFNRRLYMAASVMIGVAAEALLLELAGAIRASHGSSSDGQRWYNQNIEAQPALRQYNAINGKLESVKGDMPYDQRERFEGQFQAIYGVIREQRNESGHPTGNIMDRQDVLPYLYLFSSFARLTEQLIDWLTAEKRY